jgi:hypothetical protein
MKVILLPLRDEPTRVRSVLFSTVGVTGRPQCERVAMMIVARSSIADFGQVSATARLAQRRIGRGCRNGYAAALQAP